MINRACVCVGGGGWAGGTLVGGGCSMLSCMLMNMHMHMHTHSCHGVLGLGIWHRTAMWTDKPCMSTITGETRGGCGVV
jgi:hypothetical protein